MVVQATTRWQRFWGWLGAVPHWLYPTVLRSQPQLWSQVVIWTSLVGVFLTVLGLVIGISALGLSSQRGRFSPYRGLMLWHHLTGLVFGVFALTWVLSGLLSMNPWGLMEGGDVAGAQLSLTGGMISRSDMLAMLQMLGTRAPPGVVAVESAPLDGRLFVVATRTDGSRVRYGPGGQVRALNTQEIDAAAARVAQPGASWTLLRSEDAYHYSVLDQHALLPIVRIVSRTGDYYYLDPVSGTLVDMADPGLRAYRWWHSGLHRWDFLPWLRTPTGRTLFMLPLLLGTAGVVSLGAYLGMRRLARRRPSPGSGDRRRAAHRRSYSP
jgi:hypothetical protein